MGCDIHFHVERRTADGWQLVRPPDDYVDPSYAHMLDREGATDEQNDYWRKAARESFYSGRNYALFGVLADVRNGHGFAGVRTGNPVTPIALPRGLPDDMSAELKAIADDESEDGWLGDHSFTWLGLPEVLAYPWDGERLAVGVVSLTQFRERVNEHGPALPLRIGRGPYESWSGDISGPGIKVVEASEVIGGYIAPVTERTYVRDQWVLPISSSCRDFVERVIPTLAALADDPADIRLVFGFDS